MITVLLNMYGEIVRLLPTIYLIISIIHFIKKRTLKCQNVIFPKFRFNSYICGINSTF